MAGVKVEIAPEEDEEQGAAFDPGTEEEPEAVYEDPPPRRQRRRAEGVEIEIERERTKRQLIESITTVLVVVLYMVFTLLRDREAGVVVVDGEGAEDDWAE